MQKISLLFLKSLAALFLVFFIYANWEAPALHTYAPPSALAMFQEKNVANEAQALLVKTAIEKQKGVTACSVNSSSQIISVAYNPTIVNEARVQSWVENIFQEKTQKPVFEADVSDNRAQCPVPMSYILALENLKNTFNIRSFFSSKI